MSTLQNFVVFEILMLTYFIQQGKGVPENTSPTVLEDDVPDSDEMDNASGSEGVNKKVLPRLPQLPQLPLLPQLQHLPQLPQDGNIKMPISYKNQACQIDIIADLGFQGRAKNDCELLADVHLLIVALEQYQINIMDDRQKKLNEEEQAIEEEQKKIDEARKDNYVERLKLKEKEIKQKHDHNLLFSQELNIEDDNKKKEMIRKLLAERDELFASYSKINDRLFELIVEMKLFNNDVFDDDDDYEFEDESMEELDQLRQYVKVVSSSTKSCSITDDAEVVKRISTPPPAPPPTPEPSISDKYLFEAMCNEGINK